MQKTFPPHFLSAIFLMLITMAIGCTTSTPVYVVAGTYTGTGSEGIYLYNFDPSTGATKKISSTGEGENPSFLKLHKNFVYAVNETGGDSPGKVSAFKVDKEAGKFHFLGAQETGGDAPCYVDVSPDGKWLAVGNYTGGNFSVFKIHEDGSLSKAVQTIKHTGSGPDKERQDAPHVHSTVFSPDQNYLLANDLGTDEMAVYSFDGNADKPVTEKPHFIFRVSPGAGPRHITFHPDGNYVYLVRELDGKASVFTFENGILEQIQEVFINPDEKTEKIDGAEITLSPDNKFLYISARGPENAIAIFSVDPTTKKLTPVDYVSSGGTNPRHFTIDPSGNYLLVAHQNSNEIVVFKRDEETGKLEKTSERIELPMPVCVKTGSLQK